MVKIITIGRCCRISFDMISMNLKSKTSLFEWTWTDTLNEINYIIQKLINGEPIVINRIDGNDVLEGTKIKTCHYVNTDFNVIFERRCKRFMDDIMGNEPILFIRDDLLSTIKYEEIATFFTLIRNINPALDFKMLLLSDQNSFNKIEYPNLIHEIYDKNLYLKYINSCFEVDAVSNSNVNDISDGEN